MKYNIPSSTLAFSVFCDKCDHKTYGSVFKISAKEFEKWSNHTCTDYCNGFSCKKRFLINKDFCSEIYVMDESRFICYSCIKHLDEAEMQKCRPFWKLPKNASYRPLYTDHIHRQHEKIRENAPWLFEDLWFDQYYKKLGPLQQEWEDNLQDYKEYEKLKAKEIL